MSDTAAAAPSSSAVLAARPTSVPAIVTFWLLGVFTLTVIGVFVLIADRVQLNTIMFGLLTGLIATETTLLTGACGFWLGSSIGAKASGDAIADSNKAAAGALAKIAASAAPPSENPLPQSPATPPPTPP
jgi:hypothetical protein